MINFLLNASGTDPEVLKHCPSERNNRAGMGAMVLLTSAISTLAFSLNIQQIFHCSWQTTIPFAAVWGAGIFSLDRWLVGTLTVGKSAKEAFKACWMRLALSVVIGAWTSDAVLIRAFQPEIEHRLTEKRMGARQEAQERIQSLPRFQEIAAKQQEIDALNQRIQVQKSARDAAEQEMIREVEGKSATGKAGRGIAYEEKRDAFNAAREQFRSSSQEASERIAALRQEIRQLDTEKQAELGMLDRANRDSGGHAAQLRALGELIRSDFFVAWGVLVTACLLMLLDCLPIFSKITQAGKGSHPYDSLREKQQEAEVSVGSVAFEDSGVHKSKIEKNRLQLEADSTRKMNEKIAKDLEAVVDQAIQTIYLPEARKEVERQMRQQAARVGKLP